MSSEYKHIVFASTVLRKHDNANAVVGVTAHCKCGNIFAGDVVAGIGSDIKEPQFFKELTVQKLVNIKSCPFCAEKPNVVAVYDERFNQNGWVIECKNMGCIFKRSNPNQSLDNLLYDWNTRVNP